MGLNKYFSLCIFKTLTFGHISGFVPSPNPTILATSRLRLISLYTTRWVPPEMVLECRHILLVGSESGLHQDLGTTYRLI